MMQEEVKGPKNNKYIDSKKNQAKINAENSMSEFKKILSDKTHPDNQTPAYQNNVVHVLNKLLVSADELDSHNPGEGIFGLIVLAIRSVLKIKDENVKLEVELNSLKREIERLKKQGNMGQKT